MADDNEKNDKSRQKALEELEQRNPHFSRHKYKTTYPEPGDNSMIIKDSCPQFRNITYPEPTGGESMIKKVIDTHRVELKQIRDVPKIKLSNPEDVARFVREMRDYDRERFKVIHLDNNNMVIGVENVSEGTINAALVHPREAAKGAILNNAQGVILIHNHPSGIPKPSREDDRITTKLYEGFGLLGIDVSDVLIIGKEGYYSYKEFGRMPGKENGGIEKVMEDKYNKCSIAMKAAMSTLNKYCGEDEEYEISVGERMYVGEGGRYIIDIIIGGKRNEVEIPEDVIKIRADTNITEEDRIKKISESPWIKNKANELCSGYDPTRLTECIERITSRLAEGVVR